MFGKTTCAGARKLLPLYAAGDLAGRRARRVAAHVGACAECRRLAAEFAETREWARAAGELPEFGADFYEQLRASVLAEIARDQRPAGSRRALSFIAGIFAPHAGRRLAYAASLALAALALALALNSYPRRSNDAATPPAPLAQTNTDDARQAATPDVRKVATADGRASASPTQVPRAVPRKAQPRGGVRETLRQKFAAGGGPRTPPTPDLPASARGGEFIRKLLAGEQHFVYGFDAESRRAVARHAAAQAAPTQPAEVARIEIQTADPNIRIIWLSPREADEAEPKK